MYEDERHNEPHPAMATPAPLTNTDTQFESGGDLGRHIAGLGAVAMLVGIALAIHTWMPEGTERTVLIMAVSGVAVWVLAAFALHLGSEGGLLLSILAPTIVFLAVMMAAFVLSLHDRPKGIERVEVPSAAGHEAP